MRSALFVMAAALFTLVGTTGCQSVVTPASSPVFQSPEVPPDTSMPVPTAAPHVAPQPVPCNTGCGACGTSSCGCKSSNGCACGPLGHRGSCNSCGILNRCRCGGEMCRTGVCGRCGTCGRCGVFGGPACGILGCRNCKNGQNMGRGFPHEHQTGPFAGPGGPTSPTVGYPYYTTRGPRDFLDCNPPTIGR